MRIAYFVHELQDAAAARRVAMFDAGGAAVTLLGFARTREGGMSKVPDGSMLLGRTASGKFVARIFSVLMGLVRVWRFRRAWAGADVFVARNLETLAIALSLPRGEAKLYYECLDIHRLMLGEGIASKALRAFERFALKRCAGLITSSPAFVEHYFKPRQGYSGRVLLIENKPLELGAVRSELVQPAPKPPWRIAWCGVLRCRKSFDALLYAAKLAPMRLDLWGAPALEEIPDFDARIADLVNVHFHGRYSAQDLPRIYAAAHFVWTGDFFEAGGNSDWLLPNRLYEGLAYGAVPIAVEGSETARWLERQGVGAVLGPAIGITLPAFLRAASGESVAALQRDAAGLDRSSLRASREECARLVAELGA